MVVKTMTCLTGDSGIDVNTMMIGRRKGRPENEEL